MLQLPLRVVRFLLTMVPCLFLFPPLALCQDSGNEKIIPRGDRAELSVTVRDSSGEPYLRTGNRKALPRWSPCRQSAAAHGRAFFVSAPWARTHWLWKLTAIKRGKKK